MHSYFCSNYPIYNLSSTRASGECVKSEYILNVFHFQNPMILVLGEHKILLENTTPYSYTVYTLTSVLHIQFTIWAAPGLQENGNNKNICLIILIKWSSELFMTSHGTTWHTTSHHLRITPHHMAHHTTSLKNITHHTTSHYNTPHHTTSHPSTSRWYRGSAWRASLTLTQHGKHVWERDNDGEKDIHSMNKY